MSVIFLHRLSSSSVHNQTSLSSISKSRAPARFTYYYFFFPQQYVATSLSVTSLMQYQREGVCVFCCFFCLSFLLRFACLPVSARHVFHLLLNRSDGPSAEKSGQVTQTHHRHSPRPERLGHRFTTD